MKFSSVLLPEKKNVILLDFQTVLKKNNFSCKLFMKIHAKSCTMKEKEARYIDFFF